MGNNKNSKIGRIIEVARYLPVFTLDDLASLETNKSYLRILLSRNVKSGNLIRLKKGTYVATEYLETIEKSGRVRMYAEFLAGVLYSPSYVSLEYVLHKHGIITESPVVVTAVTRNKTASFATLFGTYRYHSIAQALFTGYTSKRDGEYIIFSASPAKALFDFLYFRKNILGNEEAIMELRLNVDALSKSDKEELAHYIQLEGSVRMKFIYTTLWKN